MLINLNNPGYVLMRELSDITKMLQQAGVSSEKMQSIRDIAQKTYDDTMHGYNDMVEVDKKNGTVQQ
jgi:hypothetical protein